MSLNRYAKLGYGNYFGSEILYFLPQNLFVTSQVKCSSNVNNDVRNDLVWDWRDDVGVELKAPTSDYESDVEETEVNRGTL